MGRIPAGIMGGVKGKVGGVIGASWKGINYIKSYVIPSNPQTAPQMSQRAKMQLCIKTGKLILTSVIQPFWNPLTTSMSGIHLFVSTNLKLISDDTDYDNLLITKGSLENFESGVQAEATYTSGTGAVVVTWDESCAGNGLLTDNVGFAIVDFVNEVAFSSVGSYIRDNETGGISIGVGRNTANMRCFLWAYRGSAPNQEVSNAQVLPWGM